MPIIQIGCQLPPATLQEGSSFGSDACVIRVGWAGLGVEYPAVLDPSWKPAGSMNEARTDHTATLLPDGDVLVVGGGTGQSTDLYKPPLPASPAAPEPPAAPSSSESPPHAASTTEKETANETRDRGFMVGRREGVTRGHHHRSFVST